MIKFIKSFFKKKPIDDKVKELTDLNKRVIANLDENSLSPSAIKNHQQILIDLIKNPIQNKVQIQAMIEGYRDILNSLILNPSPGSPQVIDQNNYITYESQIYAIYYMYNGRAKYGVSILGGIVDLRTAFIAGGGLSIASTLEKDENSKDETKIEALIDNSGQTNQAPETSSGFSPNTQKPQAPEIEEPDEVELFLDKMICDNDLNGHRLIKLIKIGEMEGKCLMVLLVDKKNQKIKVRHFSWRLSRYEIITDPTDREKVVKIVYYDDDGGEHELNADECVYVKIGGSTDKINETPPKIAKVLTQIENFDRALYDERKNNWLFGRITPVWETQNISEAKAIQKDVNAKRWQVGDGYAGTAKHYYVEPSGQASNVLRQERIDLARVISMTAGIPLHFIAYPDLLSNRATADSMVEVMTAMTREEVLIWEKSFTELFQKAMVMAMDAGFKWAINYPDDFQVKLNQSSWMQLMAIIQTWSPLQDKDVISMTTLRNMCPGVKPQEEKQLIQKEKNEKMQNSPMYNMANFKSQLDISNNPPDNQMPMDAQGKSKGNMNTGGVKRNTGNIIQSFKHRRK